MDHLRCKHFAEELNIKLPLNCLGSCSPKAEPHPGYWSWAGYCSCLCCCYFWKKGFSALRSSDGSDSAAHPRHIQQQQSQQGCQSGTGSRGRGVGCVLQWPGPCLSAQIIKAISLMCWGTRTHPSPSSNLLRDAAASISTAPPQRAVCPQCSHQPTEIPFLFYLFSVLTF